MTPSAMIDSWFALRGWEPFSFQREVWKTYLDGSDGLLHSATGTGKTLAVWLGPILEWLAENPEWRKDRVEPLRVVWITPLRALAEDTARSMVKPIDDLVLPWTVQTRTGDTKASVKAKQRKQWPTALVTTPESLCLMLSDPEARARLSNLRCVVVDEWHELLSSKRGVQVELALARLRTWNPQLRTWGLSATLGNLREAMEVLAGCPPEAEVGRPRTLIRGSLPKKTVVETLLPPEVERFPWAGHLGLALLPRVVEGLEAARSSLVFTNTRSQTELWYQAILKSKPEWAGSIALHHASLDRTVREFVERGLRDGTLRCVVCTSSLDLGVDFAPVECVFQIGSPKGVGRLMQRAGRSGHQPGGTSRVVCVPTSTLELVEFAAARNAAAAGWIEGRTPLRKPLDVLSQHVVTVALGGGFLPERLLEEVRGTHAYRDLSDAEWAWVLDFVVRGGDSLRAYDEFRRVEVVEGELHVVASPVVARRHRMAIGTIDGDASLRVKFLKGATLGTVEESFISRLSPGDTFQFAGKWLTLVRVFEMTAWVRKATRASGVVPRWMGGRISLTNELSFAIRSQLGEASQGEFAGPEMQTVRPILDIQKALSRLPEPGELLVERTRTREGYHLFVYPFEGRAVHEGLAALTAYRLSRGTPITFSIAVNDYGFELLSPVPAPFGDDLGIFSTEDLAADILASLNGTEMAKRAFREIARVAGLVFPGYPGSGKSARQLQASSNLFYEVFREYEPDNLLLAQARAEVLERQLEESRLRRTLERLRESRIVVVETTKPTPFAFPLLVDRLRMTLSSEKLADRVRRMQLEFEATE
jgi:ATP-dependent Lhr-like helicase